MRSKGVRFVSGIRTLSIYVKSKLRVNQRLKEKPKLKTDKKWADKNKRFTVNE